MGSLWYHGHTICVSQGLTLSTASLVITSDALNLPFILWQVSLKREPGKPIRALGLAWPANEEPRPSASLVCLESEDWWLLIFITWPSPARATQTSTTQSLRSFHLALRARAKWNVGPKQWEKYCKVKWRRLYCFLFWYKVFYPQSKFKQMPRFVYQGQWKWLTTLMWEQVNTTSLFTPAPETQGLHHFSLDRRQPCVQ